MSTIHRASVTISITYSERLHLNIDYSERPILSAVKTTTEFEVINASTYLQENPATRETLDGLVNQVDKGIDEAYALFKKTIKNANDVRLEIYAKREAYDKESYREIGVAKHKAFWLVKSYAFSKPVTVRHGDGTGSSTNPVGLRSCARRSRSSCSASASFSTTSWSRPSRVDSQVFPVVD